MEKNELVIIGGGPAGLTAAIYGRRTGLDVLILEQMTTGGQINSTDEIENWPGTIKITGYELADSFHQHAEHFKVKFKSATALKIRIEGNRKIVETSEGDIEAGAIVVATGASFKKLGCPGEADFIGRGVSYCAVCDGPFFRNEELAVVGGGNSAVEEAIYLSRFASKVYIIHRRDRFRADRQSVERVMNDPKVVPIWDSEVVSIMGKRSVEKLMINNVKTQITTELPVAGVFMFVGIKPHSDFLEGMVDMAPGGWIITDEHRQTSVPGIFAAGDVRKTVLRQVVTAASDGAVAAMSAYHFIETGGIALELVRS